MTRGKRKLNMAYCFSSLINSKDENMELRLAEHMLPETVE